MNRKEFEDTLLADLQEGELEMNRTKGRAYAGDEDTLRNFKDAGQMIRSRCPECGAIHPVGPMVIAAVYMHKHFSGLLDYAARGVNLIKTEPIQGRAIDLRLYTALLAAIIEEETDGV